MRAYERCLKLTDIDGLAIVYPNVYERQQTSGPARLVLAPSGSCLPLVRQLVATLQSPVYLLYILTSPRGPREPGRYASELMSVEEAGAFLLEFGEFLDRDARHHLWIAAPDGSSMIIWDPHQIIYAYGDLDAFTHVAQRLGMSPGPVRVAVPHEHRYHALFNTVEDEIFARIQWHHSPLRPGDD
jgi:hypothetical protein